MIGALACEAGLGKERALWGLLVSCAFAFVDHLQVDGRRAAGLEAKAHPGGAGRRGARADRGCGSAHPTTGQGGWLVRFLAGLYHGAEYPFDLSELRGLDTRLANACLDYLNYDRLGFGIWTNTSGMAAVSCGGGFGRTQWPGSGASEDRGRSV